MVELNKMYEGKVNSPESYLRESIVQTGTVIYIANDGILPELPNLLVIGEGENAETVLVNDKREDGGYNVIRGIQGIARNWEKTTPVARNFTEFDYKNLIDNIKKLNENKVEVDGNKVLSDNNYSDEEKAEVTKIKDKADNSKLDSTIAVFDESMNGKVDKVAGKGLSTNDYTTVEKNKLSNLKNTTIINDLTTGGIDKALSAEQGKVLFQYGDERNKEQVANLISKGIKDATVNDNLKTNISRTLEIKQGGIGIGSAKIIEITQDGKGNISLIWEDGQDYQEIWKFKKSIVVVKENSPAKNIEDGRIIKESIIKNQYKTNPLIFSLTINKTYYITVFNESTDDGLSVSNVSLQKIEVIKGKAIKELPVGSKFIDINSKYNDEIIVWIKIADNHEGYPLNSTTLISEKIIGFKPVDAREPTNTDTSRKDMGNNDYVVSNLRQWLNSDKTNWYIAQHKYDAPPSVNNLSTNTKPYNNEKGFLSMLSQGFNAGLMETSIKVSLPPFEGSGMANIKDKVFLLSGTEVGFGGLTEGKLIEYFNSNLKRIAKQSISAGKDLIDVNGHDYWKLRTPTQIASQPSYSYGVTEVGGRDHFPMYSGTYGGLRPALNIKNDTDVSNVPNQDGIYELLF